jgi:hypothetical protein
MSLFLVAQYMLAASRYGSNVVHGLVAEVKTETRMFFCRRAHKEKQSDTEGTVLEIEIGGGPRIAFPIGEQTEERS